MKIVMNSQMLVDLISPDSEITNGIHFLNS